MTVSHNKKGRIENRPAGYAPKAHISFPTKCFIKSVEDKGLYACYQSPKFNPEGMFYPCVILLFSLCVG